MKTAYKNMWSWSQFNLLAHTGRYSMLPFNPEMCFFFFSSSSSRMFENNVKDVCYIHEVFNNSVSKM